MTPVALRFAELGHFVVGAAKFETVNRLHVFSLQADLQPQPPTQQRSWRAGSRPPGHRPSSQEFSLHNFLTCQQFLYRFGNVTGPFYFTRSRGALSVNLKINLSSMLLPKPFPTSRPSLSGKVLSASAPVQLPITSLMSWLRSNIPSTPLLHSSEETHRRLTAHGITVVDLNAAPQLDVYVDGADEIDKSCSMIKGVRRSPHP